MPVRHAEDMTARLVPLRVGNMLVLWGIGRTLQLVAREPFMNTEHYAIWKTSPSGKLVKLADKLCNVIDIAERPPDWP